MLRELLDTHLGITKTKSNARSRMWWPGIDHDIERWIGSCTICVRVRPAPQRDPPAPWPAATSAWQRVHIDYMTIGQRVYLVIVDSFSKHVDQIIKSVGNSQPTFTNTFAQGSPQLQSPSTSLKSKTNYKPGATKSSEVPVVFEDATVVADYDNGEVRAIVKPSRVRVRHSVIN
ncbi:unnamed protein product [Arctia plantaginis]|uniref:RNA-directed DNA polymerase n=1 Tax=Arctia plantaginis TaxID=874455 RepID=A0A8S0ZRL5_ARCPL|nr:unnamed protein product [Arctia plantaginis]